MLNVSPEIKIDKIPIPIRNYAYNIRNRESPYYEIVEQIAKEMEKRWRTVNSAGVEITEVICTIDPVELTKQIAKKVASEKLTPKNTYRTLLAFFLMKGLKKGEDFYCQPVSHGHVKYRVWLSQGKMKTFGLV